MGVALVDTVLPRLDVDTGSILGAQVRNHPSRCLSCLKMGDFRTLNLYVEFKQFLTEISEKSRDFEFPFLTIKIFITKKVGG